jgi:hypothetical protein
VRKKNRRKKNCFRTQGRGSQTHQADPQKSMPPMYVSARDPIPLQFLLESCAASRHSYNVLLCFVTVVLSFDLSGCSTLPPALSLLAQLLSCHLDAHSVFRCSR